MFVLLMTRREICHQALSVVGLGIQALSRGGSCIQAVPLVDESVQLGKVAPVEGLDEAVDNGSDVTRRAWT
jgi:hypothetical protein